MTASFTPISVGIIALMVGITLGIILNSAVYSRYLKDKSHPLYRGPIYVRGEFYYVIPEEEYLWEIPYATYSAKQEEALKQESPMGV